MKTYEQLTLEQKAKAVERCTNETLEALIEGCLVFNDLAERVKKAWAKAEAMQTPWFVGEYIMDTCHEYIEGIAHCEAEDALYSEPHEHVIRGII